MKKLVVVITNEEEGESLAVKKARDIAAAFDAEVEVVQFLPEDCSDADRQSAEQSVTESVNAFFSDPDGVSSQVVATQSIPGWMAEHYPPGNEILVVRTEHRGERLFHTPTDLGLIRHLDSPLLISCNRKWKSRPNVLMALDLSSDAPSHRELNELAMHAARLWANVHDCKLHAMYCVSIPAPLLELDIVERYEYARTHEPDAKDRLLALLEEYGMSGVTPHIEAGTIEKTIAHTASVLKADLVIMGSAGHEGVARFFHHNTVEKAMKYLRTDMLVVKPSGA
jgi:universal stress protein E